MSEEDICTSNINLVIDFGNVQYFPEFKQTITLDEFIEDFVKEFNLKKGKFFERYELKCESENKGILTIVNNFQFRDMIEHDTTQFYVYEKEEIIKKNNYEMISLFEDDEEDKNNNSNNIHKIQIKSIKSKEEFKDFFRCCICYKDFKNEVSIKCPKCVVYYCVDCLKMIRKFQRKKEIDEARRNNRQHVNKRNLILRCDTETICSNCKKSYSNELWMPNFVNDGLRNEINKIDEMIKKAFNIPGDLALNKDKNLNESSDTYYCTDCKNTFLKNNFEEESTHYNHCYLDLNLYNKFKSEEKRLELTKEELQFKEEYDENIKDLIRTKKEMVDYLKLLIEKTNQTFDEYEKGYKQNMNSLLLKIFNKENINNCISLIGKGNHEITKENEHLRSVFNNEYNIDFSVNSFCRATIKNFLTFNEKINNIELDEYHIQDFYHLFYLKKILDLSYPSNKILMVTKGKFFINQNDIYEGYFNENLSKEVYGKVIERNGDDILKIKEGCFFNNLPDKFIKIQEILSDVNYVGQYNNQKLGIGLKYSTLETPISFIDSKGEDVAIKKKNEYLNI